MLRNLKKKRVAVVLAALAALAIAGGAYAYFTGGSNSVTSAGTVGSSTQWGIAQGTASWSGSLTALYPGAASDTEYLPFTVTNKARATRRSRPSRRRCRPRPTVTPNGGRKRTSRDASRLPLTATVTARRRGLRRANLAPAGTYTGKIDLTMQDSGTNQNACQGAAPAVTITAS